MIEGEDYIQAEACWVQCVEPHCGNDAAAHNGEKYCVACKYYHDEIAAGHAYDELSSTALYSRAFRNNADITAEEEEQLFGVGEQTKKSPKQIAHEKFINSGKWLEDVINNMDG